MKKYSAVSLLAVCFCVGAVFGADSAWRPGAGTDANNRKPRKILFVGNSYVYFNDLDVVLKKLAASASPPVKLLTARVVQGGATLEMHSKAPKTLEKINRIKWDVVILQEQSTRPTTHPAIFSQYAQKLDALIDRRGAKTVLFMTWARQHKPEMTALLNRAYTQTGKKLDAFVAPAGLAWAASLKLHPEIALHDEDKSHPNPQGMYLTACVFYATLTGQSPEGLSNGGLQEVTTEQARKLQKIAWQTVQAYAKQHSEVAEK